MKSTLFILAGIAALSMVSTKASAQLQDIVEPISGTCKEGEKTTRLDGKLCTCVWHTPLKSGVGTWECKTPSVESKPHGDVIKSTGGGLENFIR